MYFDPNENVVFLRDWIENWLMVVGGMAMIVLFVSALSLVSSRGAAGIGDFFGELRAILGDVFSISPRRVWALTRLTFIEAYRRKALFVFVVFALLFMFAGWFISDNSEIKPDRVKIYVSFVLTAISWLTLPVVLILCCFGIPEDIRLRSIHTVVTKPVRRIEIIIGRILGISMIGGIVLVVMSAVGYIWIVRQIPSSAQDLLTCRVPVYGQMRFRGRDGEESVGLNVGDIWMYRAYIEGGTKSRAQWRFPITESMFDQDGNLNFENSFSGFRSHKGDMNRQLFYDLRVYHPEDPQKTFTTDPQTINENRTKLDKFPRKITVDDVQYDLYKDFKSHDTQSGLDFLHVEVSCLDREQYIGMARPDLYIRMPDRPFWMGYWKAVLGIGMTILLVAMIGVTASSIVKGPIAAVLTFVLYLLSGKASHEFMDRLTTGQVEGGGFLESIYRLITHMNPTTELPDNPAFYVIKRFDLTLTHFLWLCKQVIPRLQSFNMKEFVANGFDVPFDVSILPSLLVTTAYIIPCVLLGYFALRIRELESK